MENNIKAVIFDLDGTLIDTEKYFRIFWPKAMKDFGYDMSDEQALELRSLGSPYAPARLKEWFGDELDYIKVRQHRRDIMEEYLLDHPVEVKVGAKELLVELRKRGILTAVATATGPEKTKERLDPFGLYELFDKVVSTSMVKTGKPSPDVYLYACKQLGLSPNECFAVEDSPNGVMSAYNAGCKVIMVPDQTEPTEEMQEKLYCCVESLMDILDLFNCPMNKF